MSEESLEKYEGIIDEDGLIDYDGLSSLIEQKKQLKKQVANSKRELEYAWAVVDFSDRKGYYTQSDGWFDLCWEYRDIGAADFWLDGHDMVYSENLTEEELNKFGRYCDDDDDCHVCIKLAEG